MKKEEKQEIIKEHMREIASKGGNITKQRHGSEHFSTIGKLGMKRRWDKWREEREAEENGEVVG